MKLRDVMVYCMVGLFLLAWVSGDGDRAAIYFVGVTLLVFGADS